MKMILPVQFFPGSPMTGLTKMPLMCLSLIKWLRLIAENY